MSEQNQPLDTDEKQKNPQENNQGEPNPNPQSGEEKKLEKKSILDFIKPEIAQQLHSNGFPPIKTTPITKNPPKSKFQTSLPSLK